MTWERDLVAILIQRFRFFNLLLSLVMDFFWNTGYAFCKMEQHTA